MPGDEDGTAGGQPPHDPTPPGRARDAAMRAWAEGDTAAAERALLELVASAEREAAGRDPADPAQSRLAQCLADLGCFYATWGSPAIADRVLVRALHLLEAGPTRGRSPSGVQLWTRLSELRCKPRGYANAEAVARRALAVCRAHPRLGADHPYTIRALVALGHALDGQKKLDEAEACLNEALEACTRAGEVPARAMWLLLTDLADLARDRGRHEQAVGLYRQSLGLRANSLKDGHAELHAGINDLAAAHERLGDRANALRLYEVVLEELERRGAADDLRLAEAIHRVARNCDDPDRARGLLERALAIEEKRLPPDHYGFERTLRGLAKVADRQHRPDAAIRLRQRVLALSARRLGEDDPQLIRPITELCHSHCLADEWDKAEDLDRRALYLAEKARGFDHPSVALILEHYAGVLRHLGKQDRAVQLAARAAAIRKGQEPSNPRDPSE
jgi:tetratricopeptide (TPR) repeat protein